MVRRAGTAAGERGERPRGARWLGYKYKYRALYYGRGVERGREREHNPARTRDRERAQKQQMAVF
jgi:ribosomal protein L15E